MSADTHPLIEFKNNSIIIPKQGITLQEEPDNWGFLYDPQNDFSFGVNPVSIYIWKQLEQKMTFKELTGKVKAHFSNVPDEIETDIITFLTALVENGLASIESFSQDGEK